MPAHHRAIFLCAAAFALGAGPAMGMARLGPAVQQALQRRLAGPVAVWVDLVDKGVGGSRSLVSGDLVSERSLRRRARVLLSTQRVDADDLPIAPQYLAALRACGVRVRQQSRWLNSVSVDATAEQIAALRRLACVRDIELVARSAPRTAAATVPLAAVAPPTPARTTGARVPPPRPMGPGYGDAGPQLQLIGVDALHDRGLTGLGVLVAHFDVGVQRLSHEAFRTLRIAAAYDFVDHDADVTHADSFEDALDHGQYTLSALAGFAPGKLVGAAPGVTLLLARTERSSVEAPSEEDAWIAALEWADSLGADIVSSSLRFLEFDPPDVGYDWRNMDGATTRVTRAADLASQRGVLIVSGAGNEGPDPRHNTLVAPADGHDVLAVGAIDMQGARAQFSSVGPTTDVPARTKPDLMAPGVDVVAADVISDSAYTRVSGTSLSTPLAAGVAALLLSVHDATPAQVRDALRRTASNALSPDNEQGWGTIDALAAYRYLVRLFPTAVEGSFDLQPDLRFANPYHVPSPITYDLPRGSLAALRIYDALGRRVRQLAGASPGKRSGQLSWDGRDDAGQPLPRGVYLVDLQVRDGRALQRTQHKLTLLR